MAVEYDAKHFYVTFGGYTVAGHEQWQCGLRFAPTAGGYSDSQLMSALDAISILDIYDDVKAAFQGAVAGVRQQSLTTLEFAKIALIDLDGTYVTDAKEHRAKAAGTVASTTSIPPQLAVAISFRSGTKIGHANHGRFYWPLPIDWVNSIEPSTGQITTTNVDALRGALKTMIEAIAGEVNTVQVPTDLAIFSPKTPKSVHVTAPSHKTVQAMGIGWTVDTQRSRRRSLPDGITTWSTLST